MPERRRPPIPGDRERSRRDRPGVGIIEKAAAFFAWGSFLVSVLAAPSSTFVEMSVWKSAFYICNSFIFYFVVRNPGLLVASSWAEFDDLLEKTDHAKYVLGTLPLYPALVLIATLYIAIRQDDFIGALFALLPFWTASGTDRARPGKSGD